MLVRTSTFFSLILSEPDLALSLSDIYREDESLQIKSSLLLTALLTIPQPAWAESITESFCDDSKEKVAEVIQQLPIQGDVITKWVGTQVLMLDGTCYITNSYLVDDNKLIDMLADERERKGMSRNEAQIKENLLSKPYKARFIDSTRQTSLRSADGILEIPNVILRAKYGTVGDMEPFDVVIDTNKIKK